MMNRAFACIALFSTLCLLGSPIVGQAQGEKTECDLEALFQAANELEATGDPIEDLGALSVLNAQLRAGIAGCNGLRWEGRNAKTIGPFELAPGIYNVTLTTDGYFIADFQVLSGQCESSYSGGLFSILRNQASEGAQVVIISDGCRALVPTSSVTEPWTMMIEKLE